MIEQESERALLAQKKANEFMLISAGYCDISKTPDGRRYWKIPGDSSSGEFFDRNNLALIDVLINDIENLAKRLMRKFGREDWVTFVCSVPGAREMLAGMINNTVSDKLYEWSRR